MSDKSSTLSRNLVRTVAQNELGNAVFSAAEVALDSNISEGILREFPVVGTIASLVRAGNSISEELFIRKIFRFLNGLDEVPLKERQRLLEKYPDASAEQKALGEKLLLALERLDDSAKPALLARFFAAYIREEIDYTTFTRLASALEKFNLALLPNLRNFYTEEGLIVDSQEEISHELSLAGLVLVQLSGSGTFGGSAGYRQSSLGKTFLRIGFDVHII